MESLAQIVTKTRRYLLGGDECLRQISSIPVVIKAVGDHQKNGSNGDTVPSEKTRPKSKLTASK
jgi:hypothetical protein